MKAGKLVFFQQSSCRKGTLLTAQQKLTVVSGDVAA